MWFTDCSQSAGTDLKICLQPGLPATDLYFGLQQYTAPQAKKMRFCDAEIAFPIAKSSGYIAGMQKKSPVAPPGQWALSSKVLRKGKFIVY